MIIANRTCDSHSEALDGVLHAWAESLAGSMATPAQIRMGVFDRAVRVLAEAHRLPTTHLSASPLFVKPAHRQVIPRCRPIDLAMAFGRWEEASGDADRRPRQRRGVYYTPWQVAAPIVDACVGELIEHVFVGVSDEAQAVRAAESIWNEVRICDPACGAGNFLLVCLDRFDRRLEEANVSNRALWRGRFVEYCLYGIDIDPVAIQVAQRLLWLAVGDPDRAMNGGSSHFVSDDALLGERTKWNNRFDAVVGNPPFVDSETSCAHKGGKAWRKRVRDRYRSAAGNWDTASIFVERGIELLKPGGRLGLVLPRRILGSDHAAAVQQIMSEQTLESIEPVSDEHVFEGASIQTVRLVLCKERADEGHVFQVGRGDQGQRHVEQAALRSLPAGHWSLLLARDGEHSSPTNNLDWVVSLLRQWPALGDIAKVSDGATTAQAYALRDLVREANPESTEEFVQLVNTGTIDPFRIRWSQRDTRYLGRRLARPVVSLAALRSAMPRRALQARCAKVLVAGLATRIEAVADAGRVLCGKSAVQIIPENPGLIDALAAWLNAEPISDLYRALFGCRSLGKNSLSIGPRQLALLPVPRQMLEKPFAAPSICMLHEFGVNLHRMSPHDPARQATIQRLDELVREWLVNDFQDSPTSCALVGTR